jgi:DNA-directed RNA polymerase specialized sigma24 family protein
MSRTFILFRDAMADKICEGVKTVTRRRSKRKRLHPGMEVEARIAPFAEPFAFLRILAVRYEAYPGHLCTNPELTNEAHKEGFATWSDFIGYYSALAGPTAFRERCWRIEFEAESAAARKRKRALALCAAGYSFTDTAQRMGISVNYACYLVRTGVERLREALGLMGDVVVEPEREG